MKTFEATVSQLVSCIKHHESVQAFQQADAKIKSLPELEHLAHTMKAYQQDAVLFKKIEKERAGQIAERQADALQSELSDLPIVLDYREKMQDASDLIQYIARTLENKINEELSYDK